MWRLALVVVVEVEVVSVNGGFGRAARYRDLEYGQS